MSDSTDDFLSSMKALIRSNLIDVNTSLDGRVVSYSNGLATVQPIGSKTIDDVAQPFPLIYNVPIRWPSFSGGACGVKGSVQAGDKVLIVFSQQATDGSDDGRRFDLTDAYAIIASNETGAGGANNDDMIMWFNDASIRITSGGEVLIKAPAGFKVESPQSEFSAMVTVKGMFTFLAGMTGSATAGAAAAITGTINFVGQLFSNGKRIDDSHTHKGVQSGSDSSGSVN
jgi:hypothetical protein